MHLETFEVSLFVG